MAGVGDEIGAHPLDPVRLRQIEQRQHDIAGGRRRRAQRADADLVYPLDRHALAPDHRLLFARGGDAPHAVDDFGRAQRQNQRVARPQRRQNGARRLIGRDDQHVP